MAKLLPYNATLTARIDLEPTLAIFRLRPDEIIRKGASTGPWFIPGQYVTIGMNREVVAGEDDPRPVSVRRPMSIASPPEDEDELEFYIRKVSTPESDLPLTHVMWNIEVGERMYCRAAATGKFTVEDTVGLEDKRLKVCLAAGTGMAPFISIARSRVRRDPNARLDDLAILHGASYPTSLGYREECEQLARDNGLKYVATISRPKDVPNWTGFSGRAEGLVAENLAKTEQACGLGEGGMRPDKAVILICGLTGTIANTIIALLKRGFVPDNKRLRRALEVPDDMPASIFWEQYDTEPVIDVKDAALIDRLKAELRAAV